MSPFSNPTRREFLKTTGGILGASTLPAPFVWAASKTQDPEAKKPTLVIVYLRGGCDPLNVVVPFRDRDYYAIRPTIAIPGPGTKDLPEGTQPCIPLTKSFGLHPTMAPLKPLWDQGLFAPILNVGSTHPTRSHFDAQDFMEWAAPGIKSIQEGWLNRYLQRTATPNDHFLRAFSPQPLLPRALRGEYSVLAAPGPGSDAALDAFAELYECEDGTNEKSSTGVAPGGTPPQDKEEDAKKKKGEPVAERPPVTEEMLEDRLIDAGANTVTKLRHLNGILRNAREARKKYPRGQLGQQFADIAAVISANQPIEIAAIDYGGWDHHSYQGGTTGAQANMLGYLAECMAAFANNLGPRMKNVCVLTMTEFGRTVAENGTQGTDHGHGGFMMAMGGPVQGGEIFGKWTGLHPSRLYMKRDLPVWTDFRDVFAETLTGLYQFDWKEEDFFPGFRDPAKKPLGLFRAREG